MLVQRWNSFSCNNSSSHYLVARFTTKAIAAEVSTELREFLSAHAGDNDELSLAMVELAIKHDFEWGVGNTLVWGDDWEEGDWLSLQVDLHDDRVLLYHSYCLGLDGISPYIEARGGEVCHGWGEPELAVLFQLSDDALGRAVQGELDAFFSAEPTKQEGPWGSGLSYSPNRFWWCDERTGGFCAQFSLEQMDELKLYLEGPAFTDYRLVLGDSPLKDKLRIMSDCPQCPACDGLLRLIEADLMLPADQAACSSCGGMFELASLAVSGAIVRLGKHQVIALEASDDGALALNTEGAIWGWAPDQGWASLGPKAEVGNASAMLIRRSGEILVAGYSSNLAVSRDQGHSWESVSVPQEFSGQDFVETPGRQLFACGFNGVIVREEGKTMTVCRPNRTSITSIDAASDLVLYAVTANGRILRTENAGNSWQTCKAPARESLARVLVLSETINTVDVHVVIVGSKGVVLTSVDGQSWEPGHGAGTADINDVVIGPDGRLYAVCSSSELLISDDGGRTWIVRQSKLREPLHSVCTTKSGQLFVAGDNGLVACLGDCTK